MSDERVVVYCHDGLLSWTTIDAEKLERLVKSGDLVVQIVAECLTERDAIEFCRGKSDGKEIGMWVLEQIRQDPDNQGVYFINALFALRLNYIQHTRMMKVIKVFDSQVSGKDMGRSLIAKMRKDPGNRDYYLHKAFEDCYGDPRVLIEMIETLANVPHV